MMSAHPAAAGARPVALTGIACGMGAGALWGLVFLAPALIRSFNPLELTIGRYLSYGLISVVLIAPRWKSLQPLIGRREWLALAWLALAGNTLYYLLLSSAVQSGGIAMTSLVIGFLPVAVTIVGSLERHAVPLSKLAPSLLLCVAGALCIGWEALVAPGSSTDRMVGLLCAIGALILWTGYAIGNSRWLARVPEVSAHEWNLLIGLMTGAQSLLLIPVALLMDRSGHTASAWAQFGGISIGLALLASIGGSALWNRMTRLLPLTLVGQMILFETMFALLYGFLWEQRLPTLLEAVAFAFVVLSVLACLAAHRKPSAPQRHQFRFRTPVQTC